MGALRGEAIVGAASPAVSRHDRHPLSLDGGPQSDPLAARIFAIVDVWDALRSDRPYRKAWSAERALDFIREQLGSHFDPHVGEAFLTMMEEPA